MATVFEKMPTLLPTDTPFEAITKDLETKRFSTPSVNPSKVKVAVLKND
jgi:hypothetical protein